MNEPHLRIGPFARASSLSVKALRAYHEQGLLVPDVVDPDTGYRSYSPAQLLDAAVILRLRHLDVPLADIRTVLDARDPEVTAKVLAEHAAALQTRMVELEAAIDELIRGVEQPGAHTPVHRRTEPALTVLALPGEVAPDAFEHFLADAGLRLVEAAVLDGATIDGPVGACFPIPEDDQVEVLVFLPVTDPPLLGSKSRASGITVAELPSTEAAVLVHVGAYEGLESAYRILGTWVAEHAEPAPLPVREHYVVTPLEVDDPDDLRTELCWPVAS